MNYYRFKTFRTSYYFPEIDSESTFLYGIYHPYGSFLVKQYWKIFTSCKLIRLLSRISINKLPFPYQSIIRLCPSDSIISFNLGTPGEEQKISMLGYIPCGGKSFFAKYTTKKRAKSLARNEISVLKELEKEKIAPTLLAAVESDEEVFFMTSRVDGQPYPSFELSPPIMDMLILLSTIKLKNNSANNHLKICLSHGDFCPWNMLQNGKEVRLIDWEMGANRPLGYDLFFFIIHARLVMGADAKLIISLIEKNIDQILKYFSSLDISDYHPYLISFLSIRLKEEQEKGHTEMAVIYQNLLETFLS